jgi:two-component system chemotaxis sensor kinase CheA
MSSKDIPQTLTDIETALVLDAPAEVLDAHFERLLGLALSLPHPDAGKVAAALWQAAGELASDPSAQARFESLASALRSMHRGAPTDVSSLLAPPAPVSAPQRPIESTPSVGSAEAPPELPVFEAGERALIDEFILESTECMDLAEQSMLALEAAPHDPELLNSTFRAFHSVKGVAGFLRLSQVTRLAHAVETLLDRARRGEVAPERGFIDLVLQGIDCVRRLLTWLAPQATGEAHTTPCPETATLAAAAEAYAAGQRAPAAQPATVEASTPSASAASPASPAPAAGPVPEPQRRPAATQVKVDTEKLDALVDLVGELLIAQSMVAEDARLAGAPSTQAARNLTQLARIARDLQRAAMSMRMVPVSGTFEKMVRVAREAGKHTSKQVVVNTVGGDTELDRTVTELLHDPLVHMVRNAIDHGLESTEQRRAAGKPEVGALTLAARHEGGQIVVEVRDDGRGLDPAKLIARARERGLIGQNEALTDAQAFQLIFLPGFSTAAQVTDLSGRGVGMDVVRTNVERVRGRIEVESRIGEGTTFRIRLPLTLAIIDGLLLRIGEERYILPTEWAREAIRPKADEVSYVFGVGDMVTVRGELVPLRSMAEHLGAGVAGPRPENGIVVLIEGGGRRCGLVVDELLGRQEVVIKGLGDALGQVPGLAGGAILGDGRIGLILDVRALLDRAHRAAVLPTAA